jgi:hypothetical protein
MRWLTGDEGSLDLVVQVAAALNADIEVFRRVQRLGAG